VLLLEKTEGIREEEVFHTTEKPENHQAEVAQIVITAWDAAVSQSSGREGAGIVKVEEGGLFASVGMTGT